MLDKVNSASSNLNHDNDTQDVNSIALSNSQSAKHFFNKIGLRSKAVLFAVSISTLPVLVIGAISYSFVSQSRRQDIETAHTNQAKQITRNLKNSLKKHLQEIQYLPNPYLLDNRRFLEQQQILKRWQDQNLANSNNQLYIIDLNGNIVTNSQNKLIENQKQEEYFETVLKTNKPFVSQPITDTDNQDYLILAVPVKDARTGETVYVIRNSIPVNYFHNIIKNIIKDTTKGNYYITDASGKIFLSNDESYLGKNARQFPEWTQIQNSNQNQTVTNIDVRRNGREVLLTYAPWQPEAPLSDLQWKTVLTTDKAVEEAPVSQLLWKLGLATIATTLITGGIAAILAHRMILRIISANHALKKLGRGNLQTRIPLQGRDELTSLGLNINEMASKLEELLQQQKQETEQLRLFTNILISTRVPHNTETLLSTTVAKLRQVFNADRVVIYRYVQADNEVLAEFVMPGLLGLSDKIITNQYVELEPIETLRNNQVLAINDIREANFEVEQKYLLEQLQVKSKISVPILKDNVFFGCLIIHHCSTQHLWQPQEVNFIQQLALQFGLSLERIRLLEDSQSLKNLAVLLSSSWKTLEIYNLAVLSIRQALKADRVVIYKFDENWQGVFLAESVVAGFPCAMNVKLVEPCLENYIDQYRKGRIQATNNIYQAGLSDCYLQQLETFGVKANLVAPIIVGDNLLGLLIAHQCSHPRNWQQSEIDLFEQFARLVGLALERANLLTVTEQARVSAENLFSEQRQQNVTQIHVAATQLEDVLTKNSTVIHHLTDIKHNQAEQINNALTTATETRNAIKTVAKSARQAALAANNAKIAAVDTNSIINTVIENFTTLETAIDIRTSKIKHLEEDSNEIAKIAMLIHQIVTQTNLLAINAGIEAAHAFEDKGFSLVAEEVAALATKCIAAANQISSITNRIQSETTEIITTMELESQQVSQDTLSLTSIKATLNNLTDLLGDIDNAVNLIYGTTALQIQASKQVATVLKNVSKELDTASEYSQLVDCQNEIMAIIEQMKSNVEMYKV